MIGLAAAEHEDTAFFATTQVTGAPVPLMAQPGISVINAGSNSANGGNIGYTDILSVLAKAASVKAKPPFVWAMSPRTFYTRVLGMVDGQSRPIVIPGLSGLYNNVQFTLLGWPVFVTPFISEVEAVGSGTNQSHIVFTNATYLHLAQDGVIELAISTERFFDQNATAIRGTSHLDFGAAPAAGVIVLAGVN